MFDRKPSIASLVEKGKDILNLNDYKVNKWKLKFEKKKLYDNLESLKTFAVP